MGSEPILRSANGEEFDALVDVMDVAFHGDTTPERRARMRTWMDLDRILVAEDDGRPVATSAAWSWTVSVPGGELPMAAVTAVTVLPTHRRRGLLRAMMDRLATEARDRGEPLAGLWASEGTIYGRFGYGPAASVADLRAPLAGGLALPDPDPDDPVVRLVRADEAHPEIAPIHERARSRRGGLVSRGAAWWTGRVLADPPAERGGARALRVAVAGDDGYALYRVREGAATGPVGNWTTVEVQELVAATAAAERALLRFLSRIDLADELVLHARPVDDALTRIPVDVRALLPQGAGDALWLRVLDVPAAVAGRAWAAPLDLVLDVVHPEDDVVAGRWRVQAGPDGATAQRTDDPADLVLPAAELGALYLGGGSAVALADAGRIAEPSPGSASALDAALRVDRAPWTVGVF
ncbi:GNAT family N-acetyltransferase [Patulibacter sp. NPDC049589]|uniref:GNAT family N-acetyltransferase n=1 Tax=Patulibacter sp. NPDC049589 TaxID=3154731 RepID=UPI0034227F3F